MIQDFIDEIIKESSALDSEFPEILAAAERATQNKGET